MDEFQTINQIVDEAIRSSSYISVLISSGVFITYTLINKLIELFKAKSRNKPLIEMAEGLREVTANVVKLNSILDKTLTDAEKKETAKAKGIIPIAFNNFCNAVTRSCVDMIINNHIETNKDLINENVSKLVTTEYYKVYATLSTYEVNGGNLAIKLEKEWITETIADIVSIMYNGQDAITRISQLNSKLNMNASSYAIYVDNKTFNT